MDLMKLIAMRVVRIQDGNISIYDRGMVIIPAEMLIHFQESMAKRLGDAEAESIIFEAGKYQTETGSRRYIEKKKELRPVFQKVSATGDPSIEMGREILKMTGMGDTRLIEVASGFGRIVVGTKNSPIANEYLKTRGKSRVPVCHYIRGVMSGVISAAGQTGYQSKETRCRATGLSDECVFEFVRMKKERAQSP